MSQDKSKSHNDASASLVNDVLRDMKEDNIKGSRSPLSYLLISLAALAAFILLGWLISWLVSLASVQ